MTKATQALRKKLEAKGILNLPELVDVEDRTTDLEADLKRQHNLYWTAHKGYLRLEAQVAELETKLTNCKLHLKNEALSACREARARDKAEDQVVELQSQLDKVRELPDRWAEIVKRNYATSDVTKRRAMNYLASCANELQAIIEGDKK